MTWVESLAVKAAFAPPELVAPPPAAVPVPIGRPKSDALRRLLAAKAESDRRNYRAKHHILRQMLREAPADFEVDSEAGGIVGLTHRNGFRIHAPRQILPAGLGRPRPPVLLKRAFDLFGAPKREKDPSLVDRVGLTTVGSLVPTLGLAHVPFLPRPVTKRPVPAERGLIDRIQQGGRLATGPAIEALRDRMGLQATYVAADPTRPAFHLGNHGLARALGAAFPDAQAARGTARGVVNAPMVGKPATRGGKGPRVSRGVLAHELGHAAVDERLRNVGGLDLRSPNSLLNLLGKMGPGVGILGAGLAKDDDTARRFAVGGTLASAPLLANELAASHIGGRALAGTHGGRLGRRAGNYFSAYRGIPTYAANAAAPMATYGLRRLLRRTKKD